MDHIARWVVMVWCVMKKETDRERERWELTVPKNTRRLWPVEPSVYQSAAVPTTGSAPKRERGVGRERETKTEKTRGEE